MDGMEEAKTAAQNAINTGSAQSEAAAAAQNQTGTAGSGQGTGQNTTAPGKPYMLFETGAPTQQSGVPGIAFDFNYGARVTVPQGEYRVKFIDRDACLTLYDAPANGVICTSAKKYFINFRIEVYQKQQGQDKLIFAHDLDLKGKKVVIKFPTGILGDVLAWFPYAEEFRKKHGCKVYCALGEEMAELFKPAYRQINFIKPDAKIEDAYATYYMGIFFPCDDRVHQPSDFRVRGLHKNAAMILGLDEGTEAPDVYIKLTPKNRQRQIKEPYVCIAAQASGQAKYWNNGRGGTFKLDADFAAVSGDTVVINSATNAAGYIQVNGANIDASAVSETNPLLLVTVSSGNATFTGKSLNGGGLYEYNPEIAEGDEINQDPNEFYLTGLTKNVNNDTLALLDGIDNSYAMWRNTNDTLRKRLGEIHTLPSNDGTDGVWARYIGGKFDGGSYEGQYNLYQLGYDKNYDAKSIIGFALEKGGGNATYSFGSGEDDLFAGAVYGSWLADDGSYTDVVAKIGRFDTELNSYGDFPDSADYRHNAYSLSVEYGKKISLNKAGLYLEPQAQFIAGRLDSVNYTTDRGTRVSVDGINSYIGRVGVMFGQQLENGSDVYIKANLLHEFGGESSLAMLAANGDALTMEKDYGDTWYELGIGANIKIGRASYFYGDIERGFGGDIDKKWQINAGLRFEF